VEHELHLRVQDRLGFEIERVKRIDHGWDFAVFEVNGEWIVRVPRRPEVREWALKEAALLPRLAPALPVPIPELAIVEDTPDSFFVAYRRLPGAPIDRTADARLASQLGAFLAALHDFPATAGGVADTTVAEWLLEQEAFAKRCEDVLTLLNSSERRRAQGMFDQHLARPPDYELVLVHADLGPEHILCQGDDVRGVIDWGDARVGDPALDFAWLLHGPDETFAQSLLRAYANQGGHVDDQLTARALYFHRVGPWHEVLYGLEQDQPELVASGLAGVRARLP
jgi:aminoglycoside phosphotransferase (APT) family kinase protein